MRNDFGGTASGTVVQAGSIGQLHLHPPGEQDIGRPHQLPPALAVFVNQHEVLAALAAAIESGSRLIVLTGLPGVGKTTAAVRGLHRHADRFPDGQLYADFHGEIDRLAPTSEEVAAGFLRALGVAAGQVPESESERFALLRTLLTRRRVAVLLDGVRTARQVTPLLAEAPGCVFLVTTTGDGAGLLMHGAAVIRLGPWPPSCSYALLEELLGTRRLAGQEQDAAELAGLCAHLPLALAVAASRLAGLPRWTVGRLVRDLSDERHRLSRLSIDGNAVSNVFDNAYSALDERSASLYRAMGRLPVACVTPVLAAVLLGSSLTESERALDELVTANLAHETDERYALFDLVRVHAASLPEHESTAHRQLVACAQYLITGATRAEEILTPSHRHLHRPGADLVPDELCPTIASEAEALAWFEAEAADMDRTARACARDGRHELVVALVDSLWPAFLRHRYPRLELQEIALTAARALGDLPSIGMFLTGIPGSLQRVGQWEEAIKACQEAIEVYTRLGNLRGKSQAYHALGKTELDRGQLEAAGAALETALQLRQQIGYRRGVGLTLQLLGQLAYRQGDMPLALERFEKASTTLLEENDVYDGSWSAAWAALVRGEAGEVSAALRELQIVDARMAECGSVYGRASAAEFTARVHQAAAAEHYRQASRWYESTDTIAADRVRVQLGRLTHPA